MTFLPSLLLPLYLSSAWAPGALAECLHAGRLEARLPVSFAVALAPRLALGFHDRPDWAMAFYLPPLGATPPRLVLRAPFYLRGLRLVPAHELPLDSAEYLFNALATAFLEGAAEERTSPLGEELRRRSQTLLVDVPVEQRLGAYLDAAASFASHALAVAVELERKQRQRLENGESLCPGRAGSAPLFALWQRVFEHEPYHGSYSRSRGDSGRGESRAYSSRALAREDKELVAGTLLEGRWSGEATRDFAHFCSRVAPDDASWRFDLEWFRPDPSA